MSDGIARMLWNLAICLAFALLVWAPVGRRILMTVFHGRRYGPPALAIATGMGAWGLWILLLGVLSMLRPVPVLASAIGAALISRVGLSGKPEAPRDTHDENLKTRAGRILGAAFLLLSAAYLCIAAASALAPELSFDALNVHLPYARDSAASGSIRFAPNNWSSAMPALPLMTYVTGFLFSGVTLAKLFNALCYVLTGGVVYHFCRRRGSRLHGLAAAALFWSSPVALYEATTALIDLPFALYSAIAVLALLEWTRCDDDAFLRLSAAALGMAFACKYHTGFWVLPVVLVMLRHLRAVRKTAVRACLPFLLRYGLIAFLLYLPWMLRTWIYTGNPVFPLANAFFRSPHFTPAMERASWAAFANEGVGRSWQALLALPWTVSFHPGPFRGTLGVGFFFGTLAALLRPKSRQQRYGLAMAGVYFYTWALVAQEIRYLLPLAPLLAAVAAFGIFGERAAAPAAEKTSNAAGGRSGLPAGALAGGLAILAAAAGSLPPLYPLWVKEWTYWHSYKPPRRYLLGLQSAQEYLEGEVPSIHVYDYVNRNLTPRDRILLLNDHARFYSRVPTLYSFTVEGESILFEETEEGILQKLRAAGITYVLLNYNGAAPLPGVEPRRGVYFFLDKAFQEKHLEPVYSRNNVTLYRVAG